MDPDLLDFLRGSVRSVWSLELLMLLRRAPERAWPTATLVQELRASETVVRDLLTTFEAPGLVRCDQDGCLYAPASSVLEALCRRLEETYRDRPVGVVNAIAAARNEKLQTFADAFRLRDDHK